MSVFPLFFDITVAPQIHKNKKTHGIEKTENDK